MLYRARGLWIRLDALSPGNLPLSKIGSLFQSAGKLANFQHALINSLVGLVPHRRFSTD
jgi:hypothetical protein